MENISGAHFEEKPRNKKPLIVLIVLASLAGLGGILFGASQGTVSRSTNPTPSPQAAETSISPHILVYGFWTSNSSEIRGYSLEDSKNYQIASLPFGIKKVSILSNDSLLFINKTDSRDHGKEISQYEIGSKTSQVVFESDTGCGIDDYVVSPNKQYIALWEVCFKPVSSVLLGGTSKVYTVNLTNSNKNLIYDEVSTTTSPVHYPRAITDSGEVFLDTFLPNSGAGWAHGMSVSNVTGAQKSTIPSMANGTYGTQPIPSPDGTVLAFAGYDGSEGSGTESVQGTRRALVTTNTIELLNTSTKQRTKLANIPNTKMYRALGWDLSGQTLFFAAASPQNNQVEIEEYSLSQNTLKTLPISQSNLGIYTLFTLDQALLGAVSTSPSTLGNLGSSYLPPATGFSFFNTTTNSTIPLNLAGGYMQYIALLPSSYFSNLPLAGAGQNRGVLIATFQVKTELQDTRSKQQSDPAPPPQVLPQPNATAIPTPTFQRRSATTNCNLNQGGLVPCSCQYGGTRAGGLNPAWDDACSGSPLYVYGKVGTSMDVTVGTKILSTEPSYTDKYSITLLQNNVLSIGGKTHENVKFTYTPALRSLKPPPYGTITSSASLKKIVIEYAHNLGLNEKETADLVDFAEKEVDAPYVLVSFYDGKQSKEILPLTFKPTPDTYINIVFYFQSFESAPNFSLTPPTFPPIQKRGPLTAVEISAIVK